MSPRLQLGVLMIALAWCVACGVDFAGNAPSDGGNDHLPAVVGGATGQTSGGGDVGGSATAGGSAAGGAAAALLVDDGLLVRYFIDEAASGTQPTTLEDAAAEPLSLAMDYAGAAAFMNIDGRRALMFQMANSAAHAAVPIDGSKLALLNGARRATIEVVAHVQAASTLGTRLLHVGELTSRLSLESNSTTSLKVDFNNVDGDGIGLWAVPDLNAAGRVVVHAVLDTEASDPNDRIALYLDGVRQPGTLNPPQQNSALAVPSGQHLVLGNRLPAERSMQGLLHYAAIYLEALGQAQIDQNVAWLQAADDQP